MIKNTRIEIKPGIFIMVTRKLRNDALVRQDVALGQVNIAAVAESMGSRKMKRLNKHSSVLMDEGVVLAGELGVNKAAKIIGVDPYALKWEISVRRRTGEKINVKVCGIGRPKRSPAAMAARLECVKIAKQMMLQNRVINKRLIRMGKPQVVRRKERSIANIFIEAGRIAGCNGTAVRKAWERGEFDRPSTPQPEPSLSAVQ